MPRSGGATSSGCSFIAPGASAVVCFAVGASTAERLIALTDRQARSAAHTDLAALSERDFWPLIKQAKERVLTNDLDALERLIVDGLPADEMQAAAWALVQRVRGLKDDLARLERARAAWQREAQSGS